MLGLVQCYTDKASHGLDLDSLTVELKLRNGSLLQMLP